LGYNGKTLPALAQADQTLLLQSTVLARNSGKITFNLQIIL
jgi:hypothetical protein